MSAEISENSRSAVYGIGGCSLEVAGNLGNVIQTADNTIAILKHVLAAFGLPKQLVSDNGLQFVYHKQVQRCMPWQVAAHVSYVYVNNAAAARSRF